MKFFEEIARNSRNKREVDKAENYFRDIENMCLKTEKLDASVLELVDSKLINNLISTISEMEENIYKSQIKSFLITINDSLSGTQDIKQIEPLIKKWSFEKSKKMIGQAEYIEFMNELKEFSDGCFITFTVDKRGGMTFFDIMKRIEETSRKTIYEERMRQARKRILDFINRTKQAKEIMLSTNFALMSPFDFEDFVANLFNTIGYETEVTKKTGDYGIDVIAKKEGEIMAIQCKKYQEGNHVSNREVQRLLGSMQLKDLKANKGILITTSDFTKQAYFQAEDTPIELWNKEMLHETVKKYLI